MTTHSNILAWKISWKEKLDRQVIVHEVTKNMMQLSMCACNVYNLRYDYYFFHLSSLVGDQLPHNIVVGFVIH